MSDDRELIRESVRRMSQRAVTPHLAAMEKHPWVALPDAPIRALDELGLEGLDARDEEGRRTIATALGALAEVSPALASLVLADTAARALAGDDAPPGRGAFPLYYDRSDDRRPRIVAGSLHGTAEMMVGAPVAPWAVVAVGDGEPRAAVVRLDAPGARVSEPLRTLGMRGCPTADVTFTDVRPLRTTPWDEAVLATLRGPVCAIAAAVAAGSLETAVQHARERIQGGRPIVEHPEVRRMLADLAADAALCRAAADVLCADPAETGLFIRAREAAARAARQGVQLLGGYGYMEGYPQERRMRDARQACLLLGRGEVLRQSWSGIPAELPIRRS